MDIKNIAEPVKRDRHPLVADAPGAALWRRSWRRRYGSGAEAHSELVVLLGLSGQAEYLLDGTVHRLEAGTLLWAFAGQAHVLLSDDDAFDMWVLLVSDAVLPGDEVGLPPLAGASVPPRALNRDTVVELCGIADATVGQPPAALAAGVKWWLIRAWAHWQTAEKGASRQVHPAVGKAAELLRAKPSLATSEIAHEVGLSPGRLTRLFHLQTGQRLTDFRIDQKLGMVEAAMQAGERNLLNAALDAGFGSYSQFYRAFHARTGLSPRSAFKNN